jgi:hypothetical protein
MKNMEQHYANMAEKGWRLDKTGAFLQRYRAAEPCKTRYFVDILPQITAFDYPENRDAQDYRRLCEDSGWTFVSATKQFHVFCAEGDAPAPTPIHTDNKLQARMYLKASRKYELYYTLFTLAMFLYVLYTQLDRGAEVFLSSLTTFYLMGAFFFLLGSLWTFGFILTWYVRTWRAARHDRPMPEVSYRWYRVRSAAFTAGVMAVAVLTLAGVVWEVSGGLPPFLLPIILMPLVSVGVGLWLRRQIDTKERGRSANKALTVAAMIVMLAVLFSITAFSIRQVMTSPWDRSADTLGDRPVITLLDIGVYSEPGSVNTRIDGSVTVPVNYWHYEINSDGSVSTKIHRAVTASIARGLYNQEVSKHLHWRRVQPMFAETISELTRDEAAFWGAEEGFMIRMEDGNYHELILRNGRTVLYLQLTRRDGNLDREAAGRVVHALFNSIE